jgi:hypothetical protein
VAVNLAVAKDDKETLRNYSVSAAVISLDAGQSLTSYRYHGGGGGGPGSTLGYATPNAQINVAVLVESEKLYADVVIKDGSKQGDGATQTKRVDLTNLRPASVDIGADKDGRTYHLNLVPTVQTVQVQPKPFQERAKELYRLKLHASQLLLNENQYVGPVLGSEAEKLWVDICGVAHVEFSLYHLKNAEPWGRLQNGHITVSHPDGTTLDIGNVTNGDDDNRIVEGGPYTVWVRWSKPLETVDEFRAELKAQRDQLKNGTANIGSGDIAARALAALDQELAREPGPWVASSGASGLQKDEIVREE